VLGSPNGRLLSGVPPQEGLVNSAASRAYYAMFQAAQVALEAEGLVRSEWSHKALHSNSNQKLRQRRKLYPNVVCDYLTSALAVRRAALLRQARYPAVAVAGGTEATAGARQAASETGVALLLDGPIDEWQEAIDHMLAEAEGGSP
jgi:hypothetical protein